MHNAPSVTYPVGRCSFQRWVFLVWLSLSVVLLGLWAWQQTPGAWWGIACAFLVGAVLLGWRDMALSPECLHWDSRMGHWRVDAASGVPGEVQVVLDLQNLLILQWQPLSDTLFARRCLWLSRTRSPDKWLHVRRAVYGPR